MKAAGHEEISKIGEELILDALEKAGKVTDKKSFRFGAFYLGNWMADFTQFYDPVALSGAKESGRKFVKFIFDQLEGNLDVIKAYPDSLHGLFPSWIPYVSNRVHHAFDEFDRNVERELDEFIANRPQMEASLGASFEALTSDKTAGAVKKLIHVLAYFSHVHPVVGDEATGGRMHFDSFEAIYEELYTIYYPHDHLDRPLVPSQSQDGKPHFAKDNQTASGGAPADDKAKKLGLYPYVHEAVIAATGDIARTDKDWASKVFVCDKKSVQDTDVEFNKQLARLGNSLHVIEDFFAHSIFVEQAAKILGPQYCEKNLNIAQSEDKKRIFDLRLKKVEHPGWDKDKQGKVDFEPLVKTSYFDFTDSLISLYHIAEHHAEGSGNQTYSVLMSPSKDPHEYLQEGGRLLQHTLELINDPNEAMESGTNLVADKVKDLEDVWETRKVKFGSVWKLKEGQKVPERIARKALEGLPIPEKMAVNFVEVVIVLTAVHQGVKDAMTIYKAYKTISDFIKKPYDVLLKAFKAAMLDKVLKISADVFLAPVKQRMMDWAGAYRIGCHSLIAKDHGNEVLNEAAWACAKSVHWYIVKNLTRWGDTGKSVCLQRVDNLGNNKKNVVAIKPYIDWQDLVEFFLRHPGELKAIKKEYQVVTVDHVTVDGDSLASLAEKYRPTAAISGFTWETIAKENFLTVARPAGNVALQNGNSTHYAFKPNMLVRIPYQKLEVNRPVFGISAANNWWLEMLINRDWTAFKKQQELAISMPYKEWWNLFSLVLKKEKIGVHYHQVKPVGKKEVDEFIAKADAKLKELKKAYSPSSGTKKSA